MGLSLILDEEWGCLQRNLQEKKNLFFSPSKEKGKEDTTGCFKSSFRFFVHLNFTDY